MTSQPDALRNLQHECDCLRSQVVLQESQIASLNQQIELLRQDAARLTAERNAYWKLSGRILADEAARHESVYEADSAELINNHSDGLSELIRELEVTGSGREAPDAHR